jgi:hypothetical protein
MLSNELKIIKLNINKITRIIENDFNPWLVLLKISVEMIFCGSFSLAFAYLNLTEKNTIIKIKTRSASSSKCIFLYTERRSSAGAAFCAPLKEHGYVFSI